MASSSFYVKQPTPDEVRVDLFGLVDASTVADLEAELKRTVSTLAPGQFTVLINLTGITDCEFAARDALVKVQKLIAASARRTAWLDDRARFRGLALWVMHAAEDQNSKAASTMDQARKWLAESMGRLNIAQQILGNA